MTLEKYLRDVPSIGLYRVFKITDKYNIQVMYCERLNLDHEWHFDPYNQELINSEMLLMYNNTIKVE